MQFENNGQGFYRTNALGIASYDSFVPTPLKDVVPVELGDEAVRLLAMCSRKLGEFEGMLRFVPNAQMYLSMYVRKEALLSAQIEGTQCTFDDVLNPDNEDLLQREVADVIGYVRATEYAMRRMRELPLCTRLLREVHGKLMAGTRGDDKEPGELRRSQNWIGPAGCSINDASYVPPNVEDMHAALSELELFANNMQDVDPIVKAALIHYQFETVHPFLDGNGRLGRLLVTLSLVNDGVLSEASFYPSYQLKLRRAEYYERLMLVRNRGQYGAWIKFFCECLLASAEDAIESLGLLIELHEDSVARISSEMGRSAANGLRLLELLEGHPIISTSFATERLGLSRTATGNLVRAFEAAGILVCRNKEKARYRQYLYEDYLAILRQGGEPL